MQTRCLAPISGFNRAADLDSRKKVARVQNLRESDLARRAKIDRRESICWHHPGAGRSVSVRAARRLLQRTNPWEVTVDDWKGELQPWSEAVSQLRKARRPDGWRTTPAQLRDRGRAADPEEISLICGTYQQLVNNHLRRSVAPDVADEATQEVFMALITRDWLSKLELRPEDSFGSWLISRAWYSLKKHWGREKRLQKLLGAPEARRPDAGPPGTGLSDACPSEASSVPGTPRFELKKSKLHFEMRASHEDRQDLKTPEDILVKISDAQLLERLFARIEPIYARRRRGLFNRLKARLLEQTSGPDTELDKRASDKWRMKDELRSAAHYLAIEDGARIRNQKLEGGARARDRASSARARQRSRSQSTSLPNGPR